MGQRIHSTRSRVWLLPLLGIAGLILWLNSPTRSRPPEAERVSLGAAGGERASAQTQAPASQPRKNLLVQGPAAAGSSKPPHASGLSTSQRLAASTASEGTSIRVRVELLDGTPQAGLSVFADSLDPSMGAHYREQLTGANGLCSFQDLPAGSWRISTPLAESKELELLAGTSSEVRIQLRGRHAVSGRVAQFERGEYLTGGIAIRSFGEGAGSSTSYVEGATIFLLRGRSARIARSDQDGRFSTPPLPYGATLYASAPGFEASNQVQVYNAQTYVGLNMRRGGSVFRGRVLDEAGAPVPYAQVGVQRWPRSTPPEPFMRSDRNGLADAEGNFAFEDLWRGTGWIQISARGFATQSSTIVMDPERPVEKDYVLRPEAILEGRVLHDSASTPRNLRVYSGVEVTQADREGAFRLTGLKVGRTLVHVNSEQHGSLHESLELRAGEANLWNPRLPPSTELRGILRDEAGQPLAGWSVTSQNHLGEEIQAYSNGSGHFSLVFLKHEPVELRVINPEYGPEPLASSRVELPREDALVIVVESSLVPSLEVRGTLLDQREFQGERARVELIPVQKAPNSVSSEGLFANGSFSLGPVVAGEHHVILEADAYTQYAGRVQVSAQSTDLGTLELFDPGSVTLEWSVTAELEAKVSDVLGRELESWGLQAGEDSRELEPLGMGTYSLTLSLDEKVVATQSFQVHSGVDSTVRVLWP